MVRLFLVYNRAYKPICIFANDEREALQHAMAHGHIRRTTLYRKIAEVRDPLSEVEGKGLAELGKLNKAGVVKLTPGQGWAFVE